MGIKFKVNTMKARINNTVDRDPSKIHLRPGRDWLYLLGLFFVLTAVVSVYSYDVFIEVYRGDAYKLGDESDIQQIKYNRFQKELTTTHDYYKQKRSALELLLDERPAAFIDPAKVDIEEEIEVEGDPSMVFIEEEVEVIGDPVLTQ